MDFSGYSHTISANFIKHVYNSHSDANKEKSRGNNPVTARDISSDMPLILNFPDYIITGVVYKKEQRVIYGKTGNGTMFVLEHPQTGNKVLSAISFYKSRGIFSAKELIKQLRKDKRFDFSNAKVTDGTGGNPRSNGDLSHPAAATSAEPSYDLLSGTSAEKSSPLFQEGKRDIMDRAASFETGEEWRGYVNAMEDGNAGEYGAEIAGLDGEAVNRRFKTFHENAVKGAEKDGARGRPAGTRSRLSSA